MRNWLVIHKPEHTETVDHLRVIDAWATEGGTRKGAEKHMLEKQQEYLSKYGEGVIMLVETTKRFWL